MPPTWTPMRTRGPGRCEVRLTDDGLVELAFHSDVDPGEPILTASMTREQAIAHANQILNVARTQPSVTETNS